MAEIIDEAPPLGTVVAERYTLERFLGAGGMGAVYEATGPRGSRVALKLLLGSIATSTDALERFRRESIIRINSPHIVATLEEGVDPELRVPFMVMPLLVGHDLEALIERVGPLHPTLAVRIVRQACKGVTDAHAAGIIHRDIKPANLFLDHAPSGEVQVRVLDFGIAKLAGDVSLTQTGRMLGTPDYTAPEQLFDAKRVDARSDVWSLGMTLYHALTGEVPYTATALPQLLAEIMKGEVRPIQDLAPWVDPHLAKLVHGALVRDPDERCPSAEELSRALKAHAFGVEALSAPLLQPMADAQRAIRAPRASIPSTWKVACARIAVAAPSPIALPEAEIDPMLGKTLAGRYKLLRALGEGGMGIVYEATDGDASRVAVKVIRPELAGATARKRFVREAQVLQSLDSPHIVKVFEVGADGEHQLPFIVMELMQGIDLDRVIATCGSVDALTVARIFAQAASGIAAAHARGVVHRDVKPANLFLARQPSGELAVKICDFGVASQLGVAEGQAKLTAAGGVMGSPMYMAPEQADGSHPPDQRSDVWSLGATMFEALAGAPVWDGCKSVAAVIVALVSAPIPDVRERAPWVSDGLAAAIRKAMQRAPADRFQTIEAFRAAIEPFTLGTTVITPRELHPAAQAQDSGQRRARRVAVITEDVPTIAPPAPSSPSLDPPISMGSPPISSSLAALAGLQPSDESSRLRTSEMAQSMELTRQPTPFPPAARSPRLRVAQALAVAVVAGLGVLAMARWMGSDAGVASALPADAQSHHQPTSSPILESEAIVVNAQIPTVTPVLPSASSKSSASARSLRQKASARPSAGPSAGKTRPKPTGGLVPYFDTPP